jgi:AcrR family transcriptional regulator
MARPSVITEAQVLEAARAVFLKKGIRATTAEVARRAGIAEGSIFKRFKTKHELFQAAMHLSTEESAFFHHLESFDAANPRQLLAQVALEILGFLRTMIPLVMMNWSNPLPSGLPRPLGSKNPMPLQVLHQLTRFFERQMRAGRIRRRDPEIAARIFLGSIQNYVFFELVLKADHQSVLPQEKFVQQMVDTLWRGLSPRSKKE